MFNTKPTQRLKVGTLSIDKGDGSENDTFKMNWRFFQLFRVYYNSLKTANVGNFPRVDFFGAALKFRKKKKSLLSLLYVLHKT